MAAAFTERRQIILKLVVQEFIETAIPVASETLVRKFKLRVSSATVRNEMAALEDLGYLTHMHTSAGRIPTDAGYRFFVENLMDRTSLSTAEQRMIRHQFYQVGSELDQWIQLAGAVLARTAQNASVVTPPRAYQSRFKHLELIAIHDTTVLMVLVLHSGTIKQQTLTLDTALNQEDLRRSAAHINGRCAGMLTAGVEEIRSQGKEQERPEFSDFEQEVLDLVVRAMHQFEDQVNEQVHSDGLIEMLSQPEFIPALLKEEDVERAVERMRRILEVLTSGRGLGTLIPQVLASDGVQVVIGGEHGEDSMREYSVVLSRYGVNGAIAGVLGIIGPTRMSYPRSISTVRYISSVMSDLLRELYGIDEKSE